jgi:hypothetical protein
MGNACERRTDVARKTVAELLVDVLGELISRRSMEYRADREHIRLREAALKLGVRNAE